MSASNQIDARVTKVLMEALGVEEHEIEPSATFQGDLGAESIDYLDIIFRLEREFMIKIPRGELLAEPLFTRDREIVQDGRLTDQGLALLRTYIPFPDWAGLERDRRLGSIDDVFTVGLLASYLRWKLRGRGAAYTDPDAPAICHSTGFLELSVNSTRI
jgi:acyl carrier protein